MPLQLVPFSETPSEWSTQSAASALTESAVTNLVSDLASKEVSANKGAISGYPSLDSTGHIPLNQLPASVQGAMYYVGVWNATTNSPLIVSGVGYQGSFYKVSVAGNTTLDGNTNWQVGDLAIFDGAVWDKIDNYEAVTSVAGKVGAVVLAETDINNLVSDLALKAPLVSPPFTGVISVTGALNSTTQAVLQSDRGVSPGGYGGIQLGNAASNQNAQLLFSGAGDNSLQIRTNYTAGTNNLITLSPGGVERVRFQQNGKVGIGTTSPLALLDVNGTVAATVGTNNNSGAINFTGTYWNGASSSNDYWSVQNVLGAGANPTSQLNFTHSGTSGNSAIQFVINGNYSFYGSNTSSATFGYNGAATATNNYNSPIFGLLGRYWDGAGSQSDYWQFQEVLGAGVNPTSTLNLNHTGTSGVATLQVNGNLNVNNTAPLSIGTGLPTTAASGIQFGTDTVANLYRAAAGIVRCDGWIQGATGVIGATAQTNLVYPTASVDLVLETRPGFANNIIFKSSGIAQGETMRLDSTGKVGIGTATPTTNLQVAQAATAPGTVSVSGTAVTGVSTQFTNTFKVGDTITVVTTSGSETKAITTITSDTVLVTAAFAGTAVAGTAYTLVGGNRFSVSGNGNVGFGTTTPSKLLSIGATGAGFDSTGYVYASRLYAAGSGNAAMFFSAQTVGVASNPVAGTTLNIGGAAVTGPAAYALQVNAPTGATVNYAATFNGGNVGIGVTAPTSPLHVVGLPVYTSNALAIAGGLTAGAFYRTGADPDPVCVVH